MNPLTVAFISHGTFFLKGFGILEEKRTRCLTIWLILIIHPLFSANELAVMKKYVPFISNLLKRRKKPSFSDMKLAIKCVGIERDTV